MTAPASPTALLSLLRAGQAHHLAGRMDEARAAYTGVLEQDPGIRLMRGGKALPFNTGGYDHFTNGG